MRELKFRAWSKPEKKMIYNIQNEFEERIELGMDCFSDYLKNDDFIVEQYTGLKDKNSRKIYEGDIVKFVDLELAIKPTGVVCFDNAKFFIKDLEFSDGTYHIVDFYDYNIPNRDFEVIGNIHEDSPNEKE